jgi:hypothetical protein
MLRKEVCHDPAWYDAHETKKFSRIFKQSVAGPVDRLQLGIEDVSRTAGPKSATTPGHMGKLVMSK